MSCRLTDVPLVGQSKAYQDSPQNGTAKFLSLHVKVFKTFLKIL